MKFDPLDSDSIDTLQRAIEILQQTGGKLSLTSAIEILLEALTDLSLELSRLYQEGCKGRQRNPELKFLENAKADELGNTRSVLIKSEQPLYWNPEIGEYLSNLARFFVFLQQRDNSAALDFIQDAMIKRRSLWKSETKVEKSNKTSVRPQKRKANGRQEAARRGFIRRRMKQGKHSRSAKKVV